MLLTAPGVPFIYYGEEIGMLGLKPDEMIRTPMQWSADTNAGFTTGIPWETLNPDFVTVNVALEQEDPDSLLSFYRALIGLRNQHSALRVGDFIPAVSDNSAVYAALRVSRQEAALVVINLGGETAERTRLTVKAGPMSGIFNGL